MNPLLLALGALVLMVGIGLCLGRLIRKADDKRAARQWEERERLLDHRKPVATRHEILERRSRRD